MIKSTVFFLTQSLCGDMFFFRRFLEVIMRSDYMKEKPILPLLLSLAVPMMLSMLVNSLYNIIDGIFIAKTGESAMLAISLVYPVQNLLHAIAVGFGVGTNAVIAMLLGAGEKEKAGQTATQGLLCNILHGLLFTVFAIIGMRSFLKMFTSDAAVIDGGLRYARIVLLCAAIQTAGITFEKIFQSVGKMLISMISLAGGCLVNIILDPIFIFGIGPFPAMGIEGAAIATVLGQLTSLFFYLVVYRLQPLGIDICSQNLHPDKSILKQLYAIGIPASLNMALPSVLISVLNRMLAGFSGSYVLVLGIYYKLQSFLYLPANGVIQGMRPLMSYNYGAGEKIRVQKIYRTALSIILLILLSGTILCWWMPGSLIRLFTDRPDTGHCVSSVSALPFPLFLSPRKVHLKRWVKVLHP
jgi:putative MATE family efflux protein